MNQVKLYWGWWWQGRQISTVRIWQEMAKCQVFTSHNIQCSVAAGCWSLTCRSSSAFYKLNQKRSSLHYCRLCSDLSFQHTNRKITFFITDCWLKVVCKRYDNIKLYAYQESPVNHSVIEKKTYHIIVKESCLHWKHCYRKPHSYTHDWTVGNNSYLLWLPFLIQTLERQDTSTLPEMFRARVDQEPVAIHINSPFSRLRSPNPTIDICMIPFFPSSFSLWIIIRCTHFYIFKQ